MPDLEASEAILNGTRFRPRPASTLVSRWDLEVDAKHEADMPETVWLEHDKSELDESVIGPDERKLVPAADYAPGGKYRAICKLALRMHKQKPDGPWMMATGWLIRPDLIVTAGHVACDFDHKGGLLKSIKVYIGYHGSQSVHSRNVQYRQGKTVVAPARWVQNHDASCDVSFIILNKPFTGVTPIRYVNTPRKGNLTLGVVGYPGDKKSPGDTKKGEHMYQSFEPVAFDLSRSNHMLNYKIDTYGGNSGSPVLCKQGAKLFSVGVHVQGGASNKATVIGPWGNNFQTYISAFKATGVPATTSQGPKAKNYRLITMPAGGLIIPRRPVIKESGAFDEQVEGEGAEEGEEADEAEAIASDISKALGTEMNELVKLVPGINGTLGAIAATCIQLLLKAGKGEADAESAVTHKALPGWDIPVEFRGIAERGVVAEAALQTVMAMPKSTRDQYQVFDRMKSSMQRVAPLIRKLDSALISLLGPVVTQLVIEELRRLKGIKKAKGKKGAAKPKTPGITKPKTSPAPNGVAKKTAINGEADEGQDFEAEAEEGDVEVDGQIENFIEAYGGGDEASLDELTQAGFGEMLRIALGSGESVPLDEAGAEVLESLLASETLNTGDGEADAPAESDEAVDEAYDNISGLAQRVMLAEAALQVLVTLPTEALESSTEFGLLGVAIRGVAGFAKAGARIARLVKKYGPKIWKWLKRGGNIAGLGLTAYDLSQLLLAKKGEAADGELDGELDGEADLEGVEGEEGEEDAEAEELEHEAQAEESFGEAFQEYLGGEAFADGMEADGNSLTVGNSKTLRSYKSNGSLNRSFRAAPLITVSE